MLILSFFALHVHGQNNEAFLKANAILIDNPEVLDISVHRLLYPFQIIMFGEMHGTNESAPFVAGLSALLTDNGDSVQVGLEIPPELMRRYSELRTDSSVYESDFFKNPPFYDGKESIPWANLIAALNQNPKVIVFFFDINKNEGRSDERDSIMAAKIKTQYDQHPTWKMVTLSGNYHNRISDPNTMTSVLKRNISASVCSLNMEYKEGSCNANFTHGLEIKRLGSYPSVFNSTPGFDRYLILYQAPSHEDYDGIYFTKYITAATMVTSQ